MFIAQNILKSFMAKIMGLWEKTPKEYPHRWVQSPNWSERKKCVSAIVIHHTGSNQTQGLIMWLQTKKSKVSYHCIIMPDGEQFYMVDEMDKAWHAGRSVLEGKRDVNQFSTGVALVGDGYAKFTEAQIDSLVQYCTKVMKRNYIPISRVVGHCDVAPGRKGDPSPFSWRAFREKLIKERETS